MIVNIIPAIRLPRSTGFFSYSVPVELQKQIKIGQIIEINFRNKNIQGLITSISKTKPKYKLKEINKILYPEPLVTNNQIKLIKYIASSYGASLGVVAKSLIPEIPKRHKNIRTQEHKNIKTQKHLGSKKLFWYQDENEFIKLLKEKIKTDGQTLILVPQIEIIDKLTNKLNLKDNQVIKIHNGIAKVKFFNYWLEILSGKPKIIIGTKISVLLPFSNLNEIIIYHEHNWDHKQSDINPRFDARNVAEWLACEHGCNLTLATPAPSVEMYHLSTKNTKALKHKNANIKIVDLKQERLKGNYSMLSDDLVENIKKSKKTFIFHNRKGLANFVTCQDCGYVFKCSECEISLAYHANDKKLHCHHCNYSQDSLPLCSNCQGPNIKFRGQGVERIKAELQKEFPSAKIFTLTKAVKQWNNETMKQFNIIIGTEFVMNKIDFSQFDLIGFINFDQLLNHPDFRASEKAYQLFYEIKSQAPNANYIIQTHQPENIVLQSIKQNKPEIFYKQELFNRKELNYPPFIKIIKLIYQDKKEKNVIYNTKKLVRDLKSKIKNIEVLGPFENYPKKIYNKFKYNIIIKAPIDFDLQKIIKLVPNGFVIDVEPEKLS